MAEPILALSIPPPPTIHPTAISLPRSISPVPRPPSRSETLLRHTLHKDFEKRPSSPSTEDEYWRLRRGYSTAASSSTVVVPVSGGLSATRPSATRIQSSPVPLAYSPPRHYQLYQHHPNSIHQSHGHARSNSISPSSIPLPLPLPQQLATTPPPFSPLSHEPSSAAKRRLERTLTRNDTRVVQSEVSRRSSQHRFPASSSSSSPRLLTLGQLSMDNNNQLHIASGPSPTTTTTDNTLLSNSPQSRTNSLESSLSSELPETPPPSPPFNAVDAARVCASIEGVVHFADVEGLGAPRDLEEVREEGEMGRNGKGHTINSWWNWWREKVR